MMNKRGALGNMDANAAVAHGNPIAITDAVRGLSRVQSRRLPKAIFRTIWYTGNILLILAILLAGYSAVWEYSTRKYLKGFSDAVIPSSSSPEEKAEAILRWMANGPARLPTSPDDPRPDRDPLDTLNYASLLKICGSATNAFLNLGDSAGLAVRRLLLLDSRHMATHVVAEVLIDGRWIVVDPVYRIVLRGSDGGLLTREQLSDPAVFSAATRGIRDYNPQDNYQLTAHVRMGRLGLIGLPLRNGLNRVLPGWEDSTALSLLMERESLATMVAALVSVFLLGFLRVGLRWYGERRLGIQPLRIRQQVRRAFHAFVDASG